MNAGPGSLRCGGRRREITERQRSGTAAVGFGPPVASGTSATRLPRIRTVNTGLWKPRSCQRRRGLNCMDCIVVNAKFSFIGPLHSQDAKTDDGLWYTVTAERETAPR